MYIYTHIYIIIYYMYDIYIYIIIYILYVQYNYNTTISPHWTAFPKWLNSPQTLSLEAKRAVSSVLKVTKPVEVQTKGSPGRTCPKWGGFPMAFLMGKCGKMWDTICEGTWIWNEDLSMVSSCSFANFEDFCRWKPNAFFA